jgi:putative protein kinase ArgK-like GTPase of G3E family
VLLLDAAGKELIFLETVGAGQSEVEVIGVADTIVLVLMPGSGDSIQALKAGIMEIPDVIAINKADHPAAKTMLSEVRSILSLDKERAWKPPIVLTEATRGEKVPELWEKVEEHRAHLEDEGLLAERRRKNLAGEVFAVASARAKTHLERAVADDLLAEAERDVAAAQEVAQGDRDLADRDADWVTGNVLTVDVGGSHVKALRNGIDERRRFVSGDELSAEQMVAGVERYYQIVRCFRDEALRADRQPEFTQLDLEVSFLDEEDVYALGEELMAAVWRDVLGVELPVPFPRLTHAEAMRRFGTDKPDLRYGMELVDLAPALERLVTPLLDSIALGHMDELELCRRHSAALCVGNRSHSAYSSSRTYRTPPFRGDCVEHR